MGPVPVRDHDVVVDLAGARVGDDVMIIEAFGWLLGEREERQAPELTPGCRPPRWNPARVGLEPVIRLAVPSVALYRRPLDLVVTVL